MSQYSVKVKLSFINKIIIAIYYENKPKLTSLPLGQMQSSLMLDLLSKQNCIISIF
jgi:hypothetical protein